MKHKKTVLITTLAVVALAAGGFAYFSGYVSASEPKASTTKTAVNGDYAPVDSASFAFQITDISRKGNIVSFTIPKDARALEEKADAVVLSGLYTEGARNSKECPIVQSDDVDDSVEDYSPMSGKARVKATFADESMAKAAHEAGCLLINDPT